VGKATDSPWEEIQSDGGDMPSSSLTKLSTAAVRSFNPRGTPRFSLCKKSLVCFPVRLSVMETMSSQDWGLNSASKSWKRAQQVQTSCNLQRFGTVMGNKQRKYQHVSVKTPLFTVVRAFHVFLTFQKLCKYCTAFFAINLPPWSGNHFPACQRCFDQLVLQYSQI
jgi:hypothetical protein